MKLYHSLLCSMFLISGATALAGTITTTSSYDKYGRVLISDPFGRSSSVGVHTGDTSTISAKYDTAETSKTVDKRINLFENESTWSAQHCVDRKSKTIVYSASDNEGALKWYPKSVAGFNGALTTYKYSRSANGAIEVITRSGVDKDGKGTVDSGTETTTQTNQYGFLISSVTKDIRSGAILSSSEAVADKYTSWGQPKCFKGLNGLTSEVEIDENSGLVTSAKDALGSVTTFEHKSLYGRVTKAIRAGVTITQDVSNPLVTPSTVTAAGLSERKSSTTVDKLGRPLCGESSIVGYPSATSKWDVNNHLGGSTQSKFGKELTNKVDANGDHDSVSGNSVAITNNKQTRQFKDGYFVVENNLESLKNPNKSVIKTDALGRVRVTETPSVNSSSPLIKREHTTTYSYLGAGKVVVKVAGPDNTNSLTIIDPYADTLEGVQVSETRSGIDFDNDNKLTDGVDRFSSNRSEIRKAEGKLHAVISSKSSTLSKDGDSNYVASTYDVKSEQSTADLNAEETITSSIDYASKKTTTESSVNGKNIADFDHNGQPIKNVTTGVGFAKSESIVTRRLDGSVNTSMQKVGTSTIQGSYDEIGFPTGDFTSPYTTTTINNFGFSSNGEFSVTTNDGTGAQTINESSNGLETGNSGANQIDSKNEIIFGNNTITHVLKPQEAGGRQTRTTLNASGLFELKEYSIDGESSNQTSCSASYFNHGGLKDYTDARGKKTLQEFSNDPLKDLTKVMFPLIYGESNIDEPQIASGYSYEHLFTYRRTDGKLNTISDLSGFRDLDYKKNRNTEQVYSSGELCGIRIDREFDAYGRMSGYSVSIDGSILQSITIGYNGLSSQVTSITDDKGKTASYGYTDNLLLMNKVTRGALVQNYEREADGRMTSANSKVGAIITPISRHDYNSFDARSRRKIVATSGGSWRYDYDSNGNLVSATHPSYGDFIYTFDGMGRRLSSTAHPTYTLNKDLNQPIASYSNQRYMNLWIDSANLTNLSVNGIGIVNTGFRRYKIPVSGTSDEGTYTPYVVRGVLPGAGQTGAGSDAVAELGGFAYVAPNLHTITYDEEGNRASCSVWDYAYDARNNLIQLTSKKFFEDVNLPGKKVCYKYDSEGRRFKKITTTRVLDRDTPIETVTTTWFVWDGWKLIYERQAEGNQNSIKGGNTLYERFYTWGLDTDGSDGGLGNVGGLLNYREKIDGTTETYYPTYDGQGNVTALVRERDSKTVAEYVYGPFGELIKADGEKAASNPWRFATKYQDEESGFCYFGYRYYDANIGAWLSREPLGESESFNLYSYCHNDPVNCVDYLGLATIDLQNEIKDRLNLNGNEFIYFMHLVSGNTSGALLHNNSIHRGYYNNAKQRFTSVYGIRLPTTGKSTRELIAEFQGSQLEDKYRRDVNSGKINPFKRDGDFMFSGTTRQGAHIGFLSPFSQRGQEETHGYFVGFADSVANTAYQGIKGTVWLAEATQNVNPLQATGIIPKFDTTSNWIEEWEPLRGTVSTRGAEAYDVSRKLNGVTTEVASVALPSFWASKFSKLRNLQQLSKKTIAPNTTPLGLPYTPSFGSSLKDVSKHFFKNGKLPDNFLTKAEAKALGWKPNKGNLHDVAPGKSIGGDVFGNKEGLLPNAPGRTWFEADLNYTNGYRGSERLLYSSDGLIYHTGDHYKTFNKLGSRRWIK